MVLSLTMALLLSAASQDVLDAIDEEEGKEAVGATDPPALPSEAEERIAALESQVLQLEMELSKMRATSFATGRKLEQLEALADRVSALEESASE